MKTPIEPSEIRKGDLIRVEYRAVADRPDSAHEFRAQIDRDTDGWVEARFNWFLLERPEPVIEIPTAVTLGTLSWRDDVAICDRHETALWGPSNDGKRIVSESSSVPVRMVTGFVRILTHADDETPVPTEALDRLREMRIEWGESSDDYRRFNKLADFFDAIEATR